MEIIERHPETPFANAADSRIAYLMVGRTRQELDAMEALLPAPDTLTQADSLTSLGYFYFMRGLDYQKDAPEVAQVYFAKGCDLGWRIFQDDLDDHYKRTVLEAYLTAADAIGQGDAVRAKLSAYADTLKPCFASWVIKTMVDGNEPPIEFVPSEEGRLSVVRFYREMALKVEDPALSAQYHASLRDASLQMLLNQPPDLPAFRFAEDYLQGSEALGDAERDAAKAFIESLLETEPLSIKRWIMRKELASFLTPERRPAELRVEGYRHLEKMVEEANWDFIGPAVNDTRADPDTRGLIMCILGHAYAGSNRLEDAADTYNWVLEYFPHESHAGETAAYSLVVMRDRQNRATPAFGISLYEQFVADHPSGYYAPFALMDVARSYVRMQDVASAIHTYERIVREYPNRSVSREAQERLDELTAKLGESP